MKNKNKGGNATKTDMPVSTSDNWGMHSDEELMAKVSSPEFIEKDKISAAIHEACHVIIGVAMDRGVHHAFIFKNPSGGIYHRHWLGRTALNAQLADWHDENGELNLDSLPQEVRSDPKRIEAFANYANAEAFRNRLLVLAGAVGEILEEKIKAGDEIDIWEVMDSLASDWSSLSESDCARFPDGYDSLSENEVHALVRFLESEWKLVLQIAEKLFDDEHLDEDYLEKFAQIRVRFPDGIELTDFNSWEISRG